MNPFAVVIVLAYSAVNLEGKKSFWTHDTTLCTVLANLESTARILGSADKVVLTFLNTMPRGVIDFFQVANVTLLDYEAAHAPLKDNGHLNSKTVHLQALKVHVVRMLQYKAVAVVDADVFLPLTWDLDVFHTSRRWMLQRGTHSPINAGFFVVRPARDLIESLDAALAHGYEPDSDFYGANYSEAIQKLGKNRHRPGWYYLGANTDQGLLLHLIANEQDPTELIHSEFKFLHCAGESPKAWFPDPALDACAKAQDPRGCLGAKKLYWQSHFWTFWHATLHNQPWSSLTQEHRRCDMLMLAEYDRRKAILGGSF